MATSWIERLVELYLASPGRTEQERAWGRAMLAEYRRKRAEAEVRLLRLPATVETDPCGS